MNAATPSSPGPAHIDPADISLPPTQPIDISSIAAAQLAL
jgi:hypothetical protein